MADEVAIGPTIENMIRMEINRVVEDLDGRLGQLGLPPPERAKAIINSFNGFTITTMIGAFGMSDENVQKILNAQLKMIRAAFDVARAQAQATDTELPAAARGGGP